MTTPQDLTDKTFHRWTVLYRAEDYISPKSGQKRTRWHCRCECGKERNVDATCLKLGTSKSCGCLASEKSSQYHLMDLTNEHFDKLTVIKRAPDKTFSNGRRIVQWVCQCECGNTRIATTNDLRSGDAHSCGCDSPLTTNRYKYLNYQSKANCGLMMTVIKYYNIDDIDIQFEDGIIIKHVRTNHFLNGSVRHPIIKTRGVTPEYYNYIHLQKRYIMNDQTFYQATNKRTNITSILTLQQILKEDCKELCIMQTSNQ